MQRTDLLLQRRAVKLNENDFLVRTIYGWLIVPAEDEALLSAMLESAGLLEPGTTTVMNRLIQKGDTVIDVGANIGLLTLPAAQRVGQDGKVIAVEPLPRLTNLLERSLHLNGLSGRVSIQACAAADVRGSARIHVSNILGHSSLLPLEGEVESVEVELCPLDELIAPKQTVSVVKIDAEGYELQVWRGMRRIVSENPSLAVVVEFGPSHLQRAGVGIQEWLDEFRSPDFTAYEIDEGTGRCKSLRGKGLGQVFSMNLLLLRRPARTYPQIEFA